MRFENISPDEIFESAKLEKALIVDLREHELYLSGHIPGAINVPYDFIENDDYYLPNTKTIILYCERGGQSLLAARTLSKKGYRILNVVGGILQYRGPMNK